VFFLDSQAHFSLFHIFLFYCLLLLKNIYLSLYKETGGNKK